jgi:hypothetical protein
VKPVDDHDTVALEPAARLALGRTLGQEEQISNLIAFLVAIDASPLAAALGLGTSDVTVTREWALPHDGGRADLLVRVAGVPAALIEVKASADQHGEQLTRYDEWATAQEPAVRCFLVGVTGDHDGLPEGWRTDLTLPALLRLWLASRDPAPAVRGAPHRRPGLREHPGQHLVVRVRGCLDRGHRCDAAGKPHPLLPRPHGRAIRRWLSRCSCA